jgi:hypothetical protein
MKSRLIIASLILALAAGSLFAQDAKKARVGVILSGAGMMDGTEMSEGVLTRLALERGKATIVFLAPDVPQAAASIRGHNFTPPELPAAARTAGAARLLHAAEPGVENPIATRTARLDLFDIS